ncbi:MAG: hypothetical protein NTZ79_13325 [Proteobacteria bacterium]|nr:hypothetical protein [Pseudomonadota bacterium]
MNAASGAIAGIIGGIGPEATVEPLRRVVARTPARDDDEHLHWLVECNPRIPSRLAHLLERSGPDPPPELVRIARNLQAGGATEAQGRADPAATVALAQGAAAKCLGLMPRALPGCSGSFDICTNWAISRARRSRWRQ